MMIFNLEKKNKHFNIQIICAFNIVPFSKVTNILDYFWMNEQFCFYNKKQDGIFF